MRSTKPDVELLDVVSSRNITMTNDKLMSKERIAGSNDSVPSTHCSDEESHTTNFQYPGENGVEIVSIRRVSSNKNEDEKSIIEPIREESSEPIKKESIEPSKKESSKTSKTTKKQLFRGLFGSKRGKKKPKSQQTQKVAASTKEPLKPQSKQTKKKAAPRIEAIIPGPSSLLRQISISVELRPEIDDEAEFLKDDPEKEAATSVGVMGAENEDDLEFVPLLQRIVTASDLQKVSAPDSIGDTEAPASAKAGEVSAKSEPNLRTVENTEAKAGDDSAKSDPVLSTVKNTEAKAEHVSAKSDPVLRTVENTEAKAGEVSAESDPVLSKVETMASPNDTIENEADGTASCVATTAVEKNAPIVIEKVAPTVKKVNILDSAGVKVDALVDAFFLMTSCGRIDSACYGLETDPSIDGDTLRRFFSDDDDTLLSDVDDDTTFLTFDNSLLEDDETLRTFLEEDGTLCGDDDSLRPSEDVRRAIETLKRCASRLGVSEAELLQRIRDEQEKRTNKNKQESPPADDT
jgi:hypothetical protein